MTNYFEDPGKTRFREQCAIALDIAGYVLRNPPEKTALEPASERSPIPLILSPDLQCDGPEGTVLHYYVRHGESGKSALPTWLARIARAAAQIENSRLYIVVEAESELLLESCKAAGAGLLRLTAGPHLVPIAEPVSRGKGATPIWFEEETKGLRPKIIDRRRMEDQQIGLIRAQKAAIAQGLSVGGGNDYLRAMDEVSEKWRIWELQLNRRLDAVQLSGDYEELQAIIRDFERGVE